MHNLYVHDWNMNSPFHGIERAAGHVDLRMTRGTSSRAGRAELVSKCSTRTQPFDHVIAFSDDTDPSDAWKSRKSARTVQPSQAFCHKGIQ